MSSINEHFKLPIYYNSSKMKTNQTIVDDLELKKTIDPSANPIYSYFFDNTDEFSNEVMAQATEYYTTDTKFLTETQQLLKSYTRGPTSDHTRIREIWTEIKNDTGFKEKYYYIDT